jgi:hypothetical protein
MAIFLAAFSYFFILFLLGFLLGPIRVLKLQPRVGKLLAVIIEAPFLIFTMPWAASWSIQVFKVPSDISSRLIMGGLAWFFLILAEITISRWIMKISLPRYLKQFQHPEGLVGLSIMIIFAAIPACLMLL